MDSASWQLLKHLWEHNTGIAIAATHTANVTTKKGVDLNLFRELDRIFILDLKPLGLSATKLIAYAIFESNGVYSVADAVYEKLYTMSGGNALFLYELAKAMLEWYHNSIDEVPEGAFSYCADVRGCGYTLVKLLWSYHSSLTNAARIGFSLIVLCSFFDRCRRCYGTASPYLIL